MTSRSRPWPVVVVIVVGVAVVLAAATWAWIAVPALYPAPDPSGGAAVLATREATRSQAIVTTRASVLAALAGLGALVTIGINYRNSAIASRNVEVAAGTLAATNRTLEITARSHLTDRYTKAIEQLGTTGTDGSEAVRLGGVYALQQFALETELPGDQATVVEVLSAFVRTSLPGHTLGRTGGARRDLRFGDDGPPKRWPPHLSDLVRLSSDSPADPEPARGPRPRRPEPEPSVLAAISVLAQLPDRIPLRADFTEVDFTGVPLMKARLAGAVLRGVDLVRADLGRTDLRNADLRRADLRDATLVLSDLRAADLTDARLSRAALTRADLTDGVLRGTLLPDAVLDSADLTRADLTGADLTDADLTGAVLAGAVLRDACLVGADLTGADLGDTDLTGADLARIRFNPGQLSSEQRAAARNAPDDTEAESVTYLDDP